MNANYVDLINDEYVVTELDQAGEAPVLDRIADWIGDAATTVETVVIASTARVVAKHGNNIVEISKKLPALWAASVKASDEDIRHRMKAKFGI